MSTHYLYVCLFSTGHIKVGRSVHPKSRIAAHADMVAGLGIELIESHSVECVGNSTHAEDELIQICAKAATRRNKNEWFEGLDFYAVLQWAHECAQNVTVGEQPTTQYKTLEKNIHIQRAIAAMGGQSSTAQKLGIDKPATVYQWRIQGRIPAKYCPDIEVRTGIPCELLNADVPWALIRGTEAHPEK